ncbi:MAG: fructose-6-phosphate aldolase [Candidatus Aminicenantes bacterium]|nr:fructose-6-phosphate aldolase [Candidatus Aminicenantes bacterium]
MKFFLDTANLEEIRRGVELGLVDGVTTNPSLIAKEGRDLEELALEICELVDGPVNLEVVSTDARGMIEEARHLSSLHKNVYVKLPMIREGLKALNVVSQEGISVNVTLIFSPGQALLAAKNGAAIVSPFIGRLDDISQVGMGLISEILLMYENYDFDTEVLVASVRNPVHVVEAAKMGAEIATLPAKVLEQLMKHPLTDLGLEKFLADWNRRKVLA